MRSLGLRNALSLIVNDLLVDCSLSTQAVVNRIHEPLIELIESTLWHARAKITRQVLACRERSSLVLDYKC